MTKIILPHSGHKNLIVYKKSDVIYQGTILFCRCFLPAHGDRTVDQMTQAARSCKQNIAEGSAAAATSLETQIKLTNVARASLDELLEDYLDWLKARGAAEWPMDSKEKTAAREFAKAHADWEDWKPFFETRPAETLCNLMVVLIQQSRYLLDRMLKWQEGDFKAKGGVRERMHTARNEVRGEAWDNAIHSMLSIASTPADLEIRLSRVIDSARHSADSIKRRKGC
jgi:four helix bundle suffix protein